MTTHAAADAIPHATKGCKSVTCPTCYALVSCTVDDTHAKTLEVMPAEMEMHLQWHDRNDRL